MSDVKVLTVDEYAALRTKADAADELRETLRDRFAMAALQGMCANPDISNDAALRGMTPAEVRLSFAVSSFDQADEMMKARAS